MASVAIRDVRKAFGATTVIHGVDVDIGDGEFVVLVGPSGCGKSTLLRMIAGLENITAGEIRIGERVVNNLPPKERDIAMVFQNYALYPHMTVAANMAFSLKLRGAPQARGRRRASTAPPRSSGSCRCSSAIPRQLSGGQRQRVAMGRAIVRDPQVFLFDEPLSNLDAKLRVQMRTEIKELHQRLKTTTVYVTHDQIEAMTMADKIVVMHDGLRRADRRAARTLRPAAESLRRRLHRLAGDEFPERRRPRTTASSNSMAPAARACRCAARAGRQRRTRRPSMASGPSISSSPTTAPRPTIQVVEPTGSEIQVVAKLGGEEIIAVFRERHQFKPGDKIRLKPDPRLVHLFDETTGTTTRTPEQHTREERP